MDPLFKDYPWNSSYAFSENSVIAFVELEGLEKLHFSEINKTVDISGMNSGQIKALAQSKGYNWDSDWYDSNARSEFWSLGIGEDVAGRNTGTRINKFSSEKAHAKAGGRPYFSDMDRTLSQWARRWDEELNDSDGWKDGLVIGATVTATILSVGTALAATSVRTALAGWGSVILSADELTNSPGAESESLLHEFADYCLGEDGGKLFEGAKFALSVKEAAKGLVNISVTLSDGTAIDAVYDVLNDITSIVDVTVSTGSMIEQGESHQSDE